MNKIYYTYTGTSTEPLRMVFSEDEVIISYYKDRHGFIYRVTDYGIPTHVSTDTNTTTSCTYMMRSRKYQKYWEGKWRISNKYNMDGLIKITKQEVFIELL